MTLRLRKTISNLFKGPTIEDIVEKLKGEAVSYIRIKGYAEENFFDSLSFYVKYEVYTDKGKKLNFRERTGQDTDSSLWVSELRGYVNKKKDYLEQKLEAIKCEIIFLGKSGKNSMNFCKNDEY